MQIFQKKLKILGFLGITLGLGLGAKSLLINQVDIFQEQSVHAQARIAQYEREMPLPMNADTFWYPTVKEAEDVAMSPIIRAMGGFSPDPIIPPRPRREWVEFPFVGMIPTQNQCLVPDLGEYAPTPDMLNNIGKQYYSNYVVIIIRKYAIHKGNYVDLRYPGAKIAYESHKTWPNREGRLSGSLGGHDAKSGAKVIEDLKKVPGVIDLNEVDAAFARGEKFVPPPQALARTVPKAPAQCRKQPYFRTLPFMTK